MKRSERLVLAAAAVVLATGLRLPAQPATVRIDGALIPLPYLYGIIVWHEEDAAH